MHYEVFNECKCPDCVSYDFKPGLESPAMGSPMGPKEREPKKWDHRKGTILFIDGSSMNSLMEIH